MNQNSMAIIILCSQLCAKDDVKPLEPSEWTKLADRLQGSNLQPYEILSFSNDDFKSKLNLREDEILRISNLIDRSGSISFEIDGYKNMGINIMTRADEYYPKILKKKLGKSCPPVFYYVGNPELSNKNCIGFVGSRDTGIKDENFIETIVNKINFNGFGVVSGGAKGVDSVSSGISIMNGSFCVEYIPDSLIRKIKSKHTIEAALNNRLLILSAAKPDAGFTTGLAMMRNKFIYAQSEGTVVVKSEYNKGGTWNGAVDNLKNKRCVTFCWNNMEYKGNVELISKGAVPIIETWNGNPSAYKIIERETHEQLNLFSDCIND